MDSIICWFHYLLDVRRSFTFLLGYATHPRPIDCTTVREVDAVVLPEFPPFLPDEEEARYLGRLKDGDGEARSVLIERNLRLVAQVVAKFDLTGTGEEVDDLISVGTVGLIKAIDSYQPGFDRLSKQAAGCIEDEILMYLRSRWRFTSNWTGPKTFAGTRKEESPSL